MQYVKCNLSTHNKANVIIRSALAILLTIHCLGLSVTSTAGSKDDGYIKTIKNFQNTAIGRQFLDSSYAYAVFPTVAKAGIGIGGAHGKGRVYTRGKMVGGTTVTQVSIGFQLGGQAYSQIVFMKDRRAYDAFTSGNFEIEAGLSAIAVNAHIGAQAGTSGASASSGLHPSQTEQMETGYYKGLAVLTAGKGGLMYEASVAGQKYTFMPKNADQVVTAY